MLLHESEAEPRTSVITMISSEYTGYNYFISRSAQKFTDSKLSSGLSSCHCAQDFVRIVWRSLLRSYKRDLTYCLQTVAKGSVMKQRFQVRFAFVRSWYGGVTWCAREK